ncbi:NlpC/P60 family protein [Archangium violaceum]|uniref:NlpC/P60 family protein n=1 Tax=Archangium violaceum TaxID=83451 RepID=UPI002B2C7466|nr:NlpC/P60 family protein [Archangium gephyra]
MYQYPEPLASPGTSCPIDDPDWQRKRILAAADDIVLQKYNYCHHHVPTWIPPNTPRMRVSGQDSQRSAKDTSPMTCTSRRNIKGLQAAPDQPMFKDSDVKWQGFDCSDFTTYLYDFSLGVKLEHLSSQIDQQACEATTAGILLDINANNVKTFQEALLPGDLLYIMAGASSGHTEISHVVVWTGQTYGQISQRANAKTILGADFQSYGEVSTDTPMIVDSHYAGAAYRPFLGWYMQSLSHVRRIIGHYPGSKQESPPPGVPQLSVQQCESTGTCTAQDSCAPVFQRAQKGGGTCKRPANFLTDCRPQ